MNLVRSVLYQIIQKDGLFYSIFLLLSFFAIYFLIFQFKKEINISDSIAGKNMDYIKIKFLKKYNLPLRSKNLQTTSNTSLEKFSESIDVPIEETRGSEGIIKDSYIAKILRKIEENKIYPPMELLMEREGTVLVSLTVNENGYIETLEVIEGTTKNFILETISTIKRSQPFEPIPKELELKKLNFRIQIKYVLK